MNPYMQLDPMAIMQMFGGGGGGLVSPNQAASGAQMPGAANLMQGNAQSADRLQKLGKLFSAMGNFQMPPKTGAGPGAMPQQAAMPQMPPIQPPMPQMGGGGQMGQLRMPSTQVPPADIIRRLMGPNLSAYGG